MEYIAVPRERRTRGFEVSLKHLRAINSVATYGSFTAAAADLGITQSAVSRLVVQVERQLGISLFLRSTRNVVLTAPGREFEVDIRGRRTRARVVPMPFYKRPNP